MPTYEYRCKNCKHEFEESQLMSADSLVVCPVCKKPSLVRVISKGGGMIFKGSGFYQTDYKNSKTDTGEAKTKTPKAIEKKPDAPAKPDAASKQEKSKE